MSKFSQSGLHPQVLPLLQIFLLFVRIESLPGVQAEDPVAQIFMGRVPTAHNMEFKMIMMIKMTMMMRII